MEIKKGYEANKKRIIREDMYEQSLPSRKKYKIDRTAADGWADAFSSNKSLLHLDLSNNQFDSRELKIMAEGLQKNHQILGIHLTGNEGKMDGMGFIQAYQEDGLGRQEDLAYHHIYTRMTHKLEMGHKHN